MVLTKHQDISKEDVDYFKSFLGREQQVNSIDEDLTLPCLSPSQKEMLAGNFSSEDVFNSFKHLAKNKSSGPDGFTAEFFIAAWPVIGTEVTAGILHFFNTLHLPRIVNSTAVALVPKVDYQSHISHYRPISCCNTIYKCISKLLAARFKLVIPSIISNNQSAFVQKRSIGDNITLAQALCQLRLYVEAIIEMLVLRVV